MADPTPAAPSRPSPAPLLQIPNRERLGASLPVPLTSFVGREREIAAVCDLVVRWDVRLVTLTGPGGVGKTRLAIETAVRVRDSFPDGIWFVGLAPMRDPGLVASSVAEVLGVRDAGNVPLSERLRTVLRDKHLLLVLDNFEHLVAAAPFVIDLLEDCSNLTILVTSRIRLRVSGEHEHAVPPLGLATPETALAAEDVATAEAVRLFVERAQAVKEDFLLTTENAAAVADICRHLDGLPLAIELAAARIKVVPPPVLRARLNKRFALLTGGARDLPARQRTMRDTIAWSYDLLSPDEQRLFRRLAVFVGGCTLEAAEAVGQADGADKTGSDVFDGVAELIDANLLRQEAGPEGEPRYLMLETVREFGLEQLEQSGEEAAQRRAHALWCLSLAEWAWERLVHDGWREEWLASVAADYDNLRAAASWLEQTGDAEEFLRLVGCLGAFWIGSGHRREGRAWLERSLDPARSATAPATVRARALHSAAWLAANRGDHEAATSQASEALALWRDLGDRLGMTQALSILTLSDLTRGDYEGVAAHAAETEALLTELGRGAPEERGPRWLRAGARIQVGAAAFGQGDLARAAVVLEDGIALCRALEEPGSGAWWAANFLALVECARGDRASAAARLVENLSVWGTGEPLAETLAGVAVLAVVSGASEQAARLFGAAEALRDRLGHAFLLPERAAFERGLDTARAVLGEVDFASARAAGCALPLEETLAEATAFLASVAESEPRPGSSGGALAAGLTPREQEILGLIAEGLSNREVGGVLSISPRTVENHVTAILAKLGVPSRTAAVVTAHRLGLA